MPLDDQHMDDTRQHSVVNDGHAAMSSAGDLSSTCLDADQPIDEQHLVLERLLAAHEAWFDVTRDYEYAGHCFGGYAEFHSLGEKYVLTKKAKLWEVAAHEYLFFQTVDELDEATFEECLSFMKEKAVLKVEPKPNHMTSYVSLVIVAKKADPDVAKSLRKTSYHKSYRFGLRGWAELRLCLVDLAARQVTTNAMGKAMRPLLESNAGFAADGKKSPLRR